MEAIEERSPKQKRETLDSDQETERRKQVKCMLQMLDVTDQQHHNAEIAQNSPHSTEDEQNGLR